MHIRNVLAVVLSIAPGVGASAEAPGNTPLGGPVVQGVCLLSREAVYANALAGKAATARLQELGRDAQAEVNAERERINADVQAFQKEQATLAADLRGQRQRELEARLQAVQVKASQRSQEIEATRLKALERIANETRPVIAQAYGQKKCGLLFDRDAALGGNFANDLTADVVKGLDGRIQTITFDRETLPAAGPAQR